MVEGLLAGTAVLKVIPDLAELAAPLTKGIESTIGNIGAKLTSTITPVAAGAAAALGGIAVGYNKGVDQISLATGKVGKELDAIIQSARNVAGQVVQPFQEVADVMSKVAVRTGLTGKPLEEMTVKILTLARVTRTEAATAADSVLQLMAKWKVPVEQAGTTLDRFLRISQATGTPLLKLLDITTRFSGPLKAFGFDLDTSAAMVGILTKNGQDAEKVFTAMNLGLAKMSKGLKEKVPPAFKGAEDAWKSARAALQTGDTEKAFSILGKSIRNATNDTEARGREIEIFGTKAGPALAAALRGGADGIGALTEKVREGGDTIDAAGERTLRFGDKLAMLKNRAVALLGPVSQQAATAATIVAGIGPAFQLFGKTEPIGRAARALGGLAKDAALSAARIVASAATTIASWIATAAAAVANAAVVAASWLVAAAPFILIGLAVAAVAALIFFHWEKIRDFLLGVWGWIRDTAVSIWNGIVDFFKNWGTTVLAVITGPIGILVLLITRNWEHIRNFTSAVWGAIRGFLSAVWNGIRSAASAVWNGIVGVITGAVNRVRGIVTSVINAVRSAWSGAMNALRNAAQAAWNGIVGVFQSAYNRIMGIVRSIGNALSKIAFWRRSPSALEKHAAATVDGVLASFERLDKGIRARIPNINSTVRIGAAAAPSRASEFATLRSDILGIERGLREEITHYNLTVHSQQSLGSVLQDFRFMEAMSK